MLYLFLNMDKAYLEIQTSKHRCSNVNQGPKFHIQSMKRLNLGQRINGWFEMS